MRTKHWAPDRLSQIESARQRLPDRERTLYREWQTKLSSQKVPDRDGLTESTRRRHRAPDREYQAESARQRVPEESA